MVDTFKVHCLVWMYTDKFAEPVIVLSVLYVKVPLNQKISMLVYQGQNRGQQRPWSSGNYRLADMQAPSWRVQYSLGLNNRAAVHFLWTRTHSLSHCDSNFRLGLKPCDSA